MPSWDAARDPPPPGLAPGEMSAHDLDDVIRIEALSYPSPWTRAHFRDVLDSPSAWNPVLRRGRAIVAYACTVTIEQEMEIQNLAVNPPDRGQGIGSALLEMVLREARARGCRVAHLEVRSSNRTALHMYEKSGFRHVGRRPGYYGRPAEDAILMTAELGPETHRLREKED